MVRILHLRSQFTLRNEDEMGVSVIPGSIPLSSFESQKDSLRDKDIVFYCTVGLRSGMACAKFKVNSPCTACCIRCCIVLCIPFELWPQSALKISHLWALPQTPKHPRERASTSGTTPFFPTPPPPEPSWSTRPASPPPGSTE